MTIGGSVTGWASLVCIILFIGGIQLLALGIIGKYISKIFLETKKRPVYIVKEKG
ncbi:Bactoprenol glucosyl transferase [Streptococcus gallolyticus]|uniref:Bactoprenol glucosyl transferase n=1 Tax=Streptococcus gallolyticus TaxID=315405 RepID=A0A139MWB0_9STRE|nr:Bactoprenol glucosyl transferase [Streptococcus gallolyticus]